MEFSPKAAQMFNHLNTAISLTVFSCLIEM